MKITAVVVRTTTGAFYIHPMDTDTAVATLASYGFDGFGLPVAGVAHPAGIKQAWFLTTYDLASYAAKLKATVIA